MATKKNSAALMYTISGRGCGMNTINNGGPAFPESDFVVGRSGKSLGFSHSGMTLRDYFAAKAMPAVYRDFWDDIRAGRNNCVPEDWKMGVAMDAYAMADAMLKAREGFGSTGGTK